MELLLIRHALPLRVENQDGEPADPPLSETGHWQAARMAEWLASESIDALYVSPLRRAVETAEPLARATGLEIQLEPGIVELDAESQIYVPLEELKATDYETWLAAMRGGLYANIDLGAFQRAVIGAIEGIIRQNPGRRVAVVCHGGVINTWAGHILKIEAPLFFDPTYTSINRFLAAASGERSLRSLNEAAHLRRE